MIEYVSDELLRDYVGNPSFHHMAFTDEMVSWMAREVLRLRALCAEISTGLDGLRAGLDALSTADGRRGLAEVQALREVYRRAARVAAGDMSIEALAEACAEVERVKREED